MDTHACFDSGKYQPIEIQRPASLERIASCLMRHLPLGASKSGLGLVGENGTANDHPYIFVLEGENAVIYELGWGDKKSEVCVLRPVVRPEAGTSWVSIGDEQLSSTPEQYTGFSILYEKEPLSEEVIEKTVAEINGN